MTEEVKVESVETQEPVAEQVVVKEDLVQWLTAALRSAGHSNPEGWEARYQRVGTFMLSTEQNSSVFQINAVNNALRFALLECKENTMEVRLCVVDCAEDDIQTWKNLLTNTVIPFMVKHSVA